MRQFLITVDNDGKVTTNAKQLGFSGEHNAATLIFQFTDDAETVFSKVHYFRVVIDGRYSADIQRSEDGIVYAVPQDCMRPPRIQCQLVGYVIENSEPKVIVKTEVFGFDIDRSEVPLDIADTRPGILEQAMEVCRSSAKSTSEDAQTAMFAANSAIVDANNAQNYCKQAKEASETSQRCVEVLSQRQIELENVSNALKGAVSGRSVGIKDVSPLEHTVKVKTGIGGGEVLTKTEVLAAKGDSVLLNNPSKSVRIVMIGGAYCVGGVIPLVDGDNDDLTQLEDFTDIAIVPQGAYGEVHGIRDITYRIEGNTLKWEGFGGIWYQDEVSSSFDISGEYTLNSSECNIIGFYQVYALDESNPNYQTPQYDHLDIEVSVYEGEGATVKVYGKNLLNNDLDTVVKHSFINKDTGNVASFYGYVLPLKKGRYTAHAEKEGSSYIYGALMDRDGVRQQTVHTVVTTTKNTITFEAFEGYSLFIYYGIQNADLDTSKKQLAKFDIQIEVGTTATDYEPYKEPVTYTADANGEVEIPSQYPAMTIIPDLDVELSVEYNRDINKAFQELQQVVAQLQTLAVATVPMTEEVL